LANNGKQYKETSKNKISLLQRLFTKKERKLEEVENHDAVVSSSDTPLPSMPEELPDQLPAKAPLFVGKHDYSPRSNDDLGFKKGDLLYIMDASDENWWFARSKDTGKKGYIPSNFVADYNSLEAKE